MEQKYEGSRYTIQFNRSLANDKYPLLIRKEQGLKKWIAILLVALVLPIITNILLALNKKRRVNSNFLDYRKILTQQEQNIIELINAKHSNKQIAEKLFISMSTVKTHINNIYSKLSISSRKEV